VMVCLFIVVLSFFFFFQAEDGIRDKLVTGVQTCALPISLQVPAPRRQIAHHGALILVRGPHLKLEDRLEQHRLAVGAHVPERQRSEERRVGKECRARWAPCHWKKTRIVEEYRTYTKSESD